MSKTRCCILLVVLSSSLSPLCLSAPQKLSLRAALVLTPEFCATVTKKGHESFDIGKAACGSLEPALSATFATLRVIDDSSKAGDANLVLEPKFAEVGATQKVFAFSNRELVVLVEWTVREQSGRIIWLDTVQGSARRHGGNAFTYRNNLKHIVRDSVQDIAEQSAAKMSSSPQLLKLSAEPVK